ncbi:hypothetical protein HPT25_16510 [Bacillus sp. BRMEA1]|uniref:hypothetical protein n=1 Tax=Neobacillus endophyticus TaxID=2738405 RepID=UPI001C25731E|nr:hypothetical protein [Neobacillus endophyticus]NRD78968.1 hypothetical protein [Neobacillus endophyticus]
MRKIISLIFVFLIGCTFFITTTYAKWAYDFVVYKDNSYVVTETHIEANKIGRKIGEVTKYSDLEGTYRGNFSNKFPKGTEYYEIKGIAINEAIAIEESKDSFIKAKYNGKYATNGEYDPTNFLLVYFIGVVLLFGIMYLFYKKRNR